MWSLFKKEVKGFFSNLTGYIVIVVFLLASNLFMWVFPGELNVLDAGYATIDTLFILAPWVFLFLVPAITMRMFSEEKKSGTIELLLSRPLSGFQIAFSKYLAAITLVLLSLIPCLISYISIYLLGNPVGNIDTGATWGSFIGLFLLGAVYAAIGIYASSLTDNTIIAFIVSLVLCFLFYTGFDTLAQVPLFKSISVFVMYLGINEHYQSVSRGVIDLRDIIYFIAVIAVFVLLTTARLRNRK
ncbi:MAG: gliding motility-associated ABC transporter permease subunit GldF [Bacteroidales bacterium]|nr:gliding motility-associated ABC transporter permease subunit GldF [Bacteroidales bacterium]